jgi:hypothetical protein
MGTEELLLLARKVSKQLVFLFDLSLHTVTFSACSRSEIRDAAQPEIDPSIA